VAVITSIPSQQYTPRTLNVNLNVPNNTKELRVTLTREAWPVGPVGSISANYPGGAFAAATTFNGGVETDWNGNERTTQIMTLSGNNINGVPQNLPNGTYAISVVIAQTLTTSVLAERF
jgi:hypothetical protein